MIAFLSKIIKFNKITILGVFKTDDGYILNSLTVKKQGQKLNIVDSNVFDDIDGVAENLDKNIPIVLLVDGKGVLNKKVDLQDDGDVSWKNTLDFSSIYCTEYNMSDSLFLSFCRKDTLDPIIAELQLKRFHILSVGLGSMYSVLLQPVILQNQIYANRSILYFENDKLDTLQKSLEDANPIYKIGSTELNTFQIPLYGLAIQFFLKNKNFKTSLPEKIDSEEIIYTKAFKFFGIAALVTFFGALLLSYILIQHYNSKNIQLNQENIFSGQTYRHILNLESQIKQKRKILSETGQLSTNFLTFYAYELMKSVPSELEIIELNILPVVDEVKENKKVLFNANVIIIKGFTNSDSSFNDWLTKLKQINWVRKFEIITLKKDKKNIQQFEVKLILNNV